MTTAQEEISVLENLLRIEKKADLESYRQKIMQSTHEKKVAEGVSWFPVRLNRDYFTQGERPVVEITRTANRRKTHSFQSGKLVTFYADDSSRHHVNGVINNVTEDTMTITLNADDLPNWTNSGSLGVDLLFDESTYREMFRALKAVKGASDSRLADLREILIGKRPAEFTTEQAFQHPTLNETQVAAIQRMLSARDLGIIHGPPGTGKTTTLVALIQHLALQENQVLVCAPSNTAVDLLVEKLTDKKISVVRLGHPARVNEEQLGSTLDSRIAAHEYYSDLKSMRRKSEEFFKMAGKYKRNYGYEERKQRKLVYNEAKKLRSDAYQLEFYIQNDILASSQVVACTLTGASAQALAGKTFDTVIIDEAAQALQPACWIPILKAERVIFAGDHQQLPPTVKSFEAGREGLSETLFEKSIKRNKADIMLRVQYRMLPEIMQFSNQYFYRGELKAHESISPIDVGWGSPLQFIDTAGAGFEEAVDPDTLSTYNSEEASALVDLVKTDLEILGKEQLQKLNWQVGIITPYSAQKERLINQIDEDEYFTDIRKRIQINSIDGFQGQEKEMIYLGLVRSNDKGEVGFLSDQRRLNVAITRAKQRMVIVGNSATLGENAFLSSLVEFYTAKGYYKSIFETQSWNFQ